MKHYNTIIKLFIFLSSIKPIFTRIVSEVTDHGITLLRGTSSELDEVKADIHKLLQDVENSSSDRKKRSVSDNQPNPGSMSLRELITHQIAMKIHADFAVHFDSEYGVPRGAYLSKQVDDQLIRTGLKKDADEYGILPLPKSHYCRYRIPTEVDGDTEPCCEGENKQCYTDAGCFCDESCYTKYGDCCTDHFVKCYQRLKLCLISIDDEKAEAQAQTDEDAYNNQGNHVISQKGNNEYAAYSDLENAIQARAFGGFLEPRPTHLVPNECCGQKPYHTDEMNDRGEYPICCLGMLHYRLEGSDCDSV